MDDFVEVRHHMSHKQEWQWVSQTLSYLGSDWETFLQELEGAGHDVESADWLPMESLK